MKAGGAIALAALVACGGGGEIDHPSEDWGGWYQTTMTASSTDCAGTELPPPMTGFTMTLEQRPTNTASVRMGIFLGLEGEFDGDSLHATSTMEVPVDLPAEIRGRATEADSLDAIAYDLRAFFADSAYTATYVIRTPDLNALVKGEGAGRCSYRYELQGVEVFDIPTTAPEGLEGEGPPPGIGG